jgi:membrane glycosyltransferase
VIGRYPGKRGGWIVDDLAQDAADRSQNVWQSRRELVPRNRWLDERVAGRIGEQRERGVKPTPRGPARAARWRHPADLARDEPQPPAMERRSKRHRDRMAPEPAQFQYQGFVTRERERGCKPLRATAGVKHDIAVARRALGQRKPNAKALGEGFSVCDDINEGDLRARQRGAQPRDQGAHNPSADDRDPVGGTRGRIPHRVERRLHVGGEHGAPRRHRRREQMHCIPRYQERALVGMQRKHQSILEVWRSTFDPADDGVTILHGKGKRAAHEGRAHGCELGLRNSASGHQPFRSPANGAVQRADLNLARGRRADPFGADLDAPRRDVPQRLDPLSGLLPRHAQILYSTLQTRPGISRADPKRIQDRGMRAFGGPDEATAGEALLRRRRLLFGALFGVTMAALLWLGGVACSPLNSPLRQAALLLPFAAVLPSLVVGSWNAIIGLAIMRLARDPTVAVNPIAARVRGDEPITVSTAILLCIRNEAPGPLMVPLQAMMSGLFDAGVADRFHIYVLSDTTDPLIASEEEAGCGALATTSAGCLALTYRRREDNVGFKAGNIRDFCDRWGERHDLAITLDADSVMPASAVLRMVRIMQAAPRLGILQGLVIGSPTRSAFARLFQFGMRLGMRSYTLGGAWWQGDCGPYWGHNAVLRLEPFRTHCKLPTLKGAGPLAGCVLSHDQLEAVLMRRGGYEVRVLPEETLGFEQNPPTLMEFMRRDLRWCQGNLQYIRLLALPGLRPISRAQLALAISMFVGSPGWIALFIAITAFIMRARDPGEVLRADAAGLLFGLMLLMSHAPKIATMIDVLARRDLRRAFGGTIRFVASAAVEFGFSLLLLPILWFEHTRFMVGLLFGRSLGWPPQTREVHALPWRLAIRRLWPQTVLGIGVLSALAVLAPAAIPYASVMAAGPALAIPLAVITALPRLGRGLVQFGIGRLPEETGFCRGLSGVVPETHAASGPGRRLQPS